MLGGRYVYVTFIALASLSVTSAKLNMNHICALVNNGLMIASNDACDAYYLCSDGIATVKSCNSGKYFNKESQACEPQKQVNCLVTSKIPCDGYQVGTWAPVAGSCSDYYYCSANGAQRASCPIGEYFNPTQQSCVWASLYACSELTESDASSSETTDDSEASITITLPINLCNFIPNGLFFGSPANCSGWNKCINDVAITGFCPAGYLYNVLKMECDLPSYVTCSQLNYDPYLTAENCTVKNEKMKAMNCSSYYVCDGSYYQLTQCPNGLYYDTVLNTCVNRINARNDCDRCAGVKSTFVNMYSPQNCTGYLYCINGVEAALGVCPSGSYFDERIGACTTTEPILGCCNPAYYSSSTTTSTEKAGGTNTSTTPNTAETTTVTALETTTNSTDAV